MPLPTQVICNMRICLAHIFLKLRTTSFLYVYLFAGVMVPPQEPAEYLYELRVISDNIVRERCETSEVHPPTPSQHEADEHTCEVDSTNVTDVGNTSNLSPVALDWKDLVFPTPSTSLNAADPLAEEVDLAGRSQDVEPPVVVALDKFAEVCEIAEEAVIDATQS
jgi:hypothetical protein